MIAFTSAEGASISLRNNDDDDNSLVHISGTGSKGSLQINDSNSDASVLISFLDKLGGVLGIVDKDGKLSSYLPNK